VSSSEVAVRLPTLVTDEDREAERKRYDLSPEAFQYLEWLTDPEVQASKETVTAFSRRTGIPVRSMQNWKRQHKFVRAWEHRCAAMNVNPERIQNLMDVLYDQGRKGSVKAIELYMKLNDRMTPERHVIEASTRPAAVDMSDDELAEELEKRVRFFRGSPQSKVLDA
jgi:hypothetical protein